MARASWISQAKSAERQRLEQLSLDEINAEIQSAEALLSDPRNAGREEAEITKEVGRSVKFRKRRAALKELKSMSADELRERLMQAEQLGLTAEADLIRSAGLGAQANAPAISTEASNRQGFKNNLDRIQNEYSNDDLIRLLNKAKESGNTRTVSLIQRVLQERTENPELGIAAEGRIRDAKRQADALGNKLTPRAKRELANDRSVTAAEAARMRAQNAITYDQSGFQNLDPLNDDDASLIADFERELKRIDNPESEKAFGTPVRPDLSTPEGQKQYQTLLLEQDTRIGKEKLEAYNAGRVSLQDRALIENRISQINTRIEKTIEQGIFDPVGEDLKNRDFGMFDGTNQRPFRQAPAVDSQGIQQELVGTLGRPVRVDEMWTSPGGQEFPLKNVTEWQRKTGAFNNQPVITVFENVAEVPDQNIEQQRLTLPKEQFNELVANKPLVNKAPEQRLGTVTFERFDEPREVINPVNGERMMVAGIKRSASGEDQLFPTIQEFDTELAAVNARTTETGLVKTFESKPAMGELDPVFKNSKNPKERIQRLNPRARVRDFEVEGSLGANIDPRTALLQGLEQGRFTLDTPLNEAIQGGVQEFREANQISTSLPVDRASNLQVQTVGDLLQRLETEGPTRFERKVVNPVREQMLEEIRTVARQRKAEGLKFTKADAELVGQRFMRNLEAQTPWTEKDANGRLSLSQFDEVRMVPVLKSGDAAQVQKARAEALKVRERADRMAIGELNEDDFDSLIARQFADRNGRNSIEARKPDGSVPKKFGPLPATPDNPDAVRLAELTFPETTDTIDSLSTKEIARRRNALVASPSNIEQIRADRAFADKAREVRRRQEREASVLGEVRGDKKVNTFFNQEVPGKGNIGNFVAGQGATPASDAESLLVNNRRFNSSPFANDFQYNAQDNMNRLEQMLLGENHSRAEWGSNADKSFIGKEGMQNINIKAFKGLNPAQQNNLLTRTAPQTISGADQALQAYFAGQGPVMDGSPRFVDTKGVAIETMPEPIKITPVGEWARGILEQEGRRDGVFNVGLDKVNIEGDESVEGNLAKVVDPKSATPVRPVEIGLEIGELNRRLEARGVNIGRPVANLSDFEEALDKLKELNNQPRSQRRGGTVAGTPVIDWENDQNKRFTLEPTPAELMQDLDYRGDEANFRVAQALFQQGEAQVNTSPRSLVTPSGQEIMKVIGQDEFAPAQLQREAVQVNKKQKKEVAGQLRKLGGDDALKRIENEFIQQAQRELDIRRPGAKLSPNGIQNAQMLAREFINDPELRINNFIDDAQMPFIGAEATVVNEGRRREQARQDRNRAIREGRLEGTPVFKEKQTNFTGDNAFMVPDVRRNIIDPGVIKRFEQGDVTPEFMELLLKQQADVNERDIPVNMNTRNPLAPLASPINPGAPDRAQQMIEVDDAFADNRQRIVQNLEDEEMGKIVRLMQFGRNFPNVDADGVQHMPGERMRVPSDSQLNLDSAFRADSQKRQFKDGPAQRLLPGGPQLSPTQIIDTMRGGSPIARQEQFVQDPGMKFSEIKPVFTDTNRGLKQSPVSQQRGGALVPVNAARPQSGASTRAPQMINDPWEQATSVPHTTADDSILRETSQRKAPKKEFTNVKSSVGNDAARAYSNLRGDTRSSERKQRESNILDELQSIMRSPSRRGTRRNIGIGAAGLGTGALVGAGLSGGRQEEEDERYYR